MVGVIAGSLALISETGHMLTDAASIALALIAVRLSARPARGRWTYRLVYGLALYSVNFPIIPRVAFPFFVNPKGPNQVFELWIHPVAYSLLLVRSSSATPPIAPGGGTDTLPYLLSVCGKRTRLTRPACTSARVSLSGLSLSGVLDLAVRVCCALVSA